MSLEEIRDLRLAMMDFLEPVEESEEVRSLLARMGAPPSSVVERDQHGSVRRSAGSGTYIRIGLEARQRPWRNLSSRS